MPHGLGAESAQTWNSSSKNLHTIPRWECVSGVAGKKRGAPTVGRLPLKERLRTRLRQAIRMALRFAGAQDRARRAVGGIAGVRAAGGAGWIEVETERLVHEDSLVAIVRPAVRAAAVRERFAVVQAIQLADARRQLVGGCGAAGALRVAVREHRAEQRGAGA